MQFITYSLSLNAVFEGVLLVFMCKTGFKLAGESRGDSSAKVSRGACCSGNCGYPGCSAGAVRQAACPPWKSRGCCPGRQPCPAHNACRREDLLLSRAGKAVRSRWAPAVTFCKICRREEHRVRLLAGCCLLTLLPSKSESRFWLVVWPLATTFWSPWQKENRCSNDRSWF